MPSKMPTIRKSGVVCSVRSRNKPPRIPTRRLPTAENPSPVTSPIEEKSFRFQPGDCALLHSDGLAEAHAPDREMFGFPRVAELAGRGASGEALIDLCLTELSAFTGPDAEQEDDITLVSLERSRSTLPAGGCT